MLLPAEAGSELRFIWDLVTSVHPSVEIGSSRLSAVVNCSTVLMFAAAILGRGSVGCCLKW
jgi:hypothetical protein